jgi:hypothetical protein
MNANVGSTDKIVRVVLALAAAVLAFVTGIGSALGIVLLVVGVCSPPRRSPASARSTGCSA